MRPEEPIDGAIRASLEPVIVQQFFAVGCYMAEIFAHYIAAWLILDAASSTSELNFTFLPSRLAFSFTCISRSFTGQELIAIHQHLSLSLDFLMRSKTVASLDPKVYIFPPFRSLEERKEVVERGKLQCSSTTSFSALSYVKA